MGRLFLIPLEGPVYKCKACQTGLGLAKNIIKRTNLVGSNQKIHAFSKLFNVYLVASPSPLTSFIYCVNCSFLLGAYRVTENVSAYCVSRKKLHGPEGSDDEV